MGNLFLTFEVSFANLHGILYGASFVGHTVKISVKINKNATWKSEDVMIMQKYELNKSLLAVTETICGCWAQNLCLVVFKV